MTPDRFVHYMVNVPAIDADHLNLLTQMDTIIKNTRELSVSEVSKLLKTLKIDLAAHFLREESYMISINFPYFDSHKSAHDDMSVVIDTSISGMIRDGKMSEYYISNLEELLVKHIDHQDMQYAQWVISHREIGDTHY